MREPLTAKPEKAAKHVVWWPFALPPRKVDRKGHAIRAAELTAPGHYDDILFLSAKQTAMDPQRKAEV